VGKISLGYLSVALRQLWYWITGLF
jgi:hypothetical protein